MRGQPPVELPAGAAARLSELTLARDAALDAAHSAAGRLNRLPQDSDQRTRNALAAEHSKHQHRFGQLSQLVSRCNQWRMELRGVTLEPACPVVFKPRDNETLPAAVERLRSQIASTKQSLQRVRSAPLPLDAQRGLIVQAVAEKARAGRPSVRIANDAASISWPEGTSIVSLMAWLQPQQMIETLVAELHEAEGAMSAQERDSAVSRLQDQLEQLERSEQALLEYADANGIDVLPRIDMSPPAFLGVVITPATAQVA
jgi:hypothetical protein